MIYAIIKCQFIWASSCVPFPSVPPAIPFRSFRWRRLRSIRLNFKSDNGY